jgi:hypothetical protein
MLVPEDFLNIQQAVVVAQNGDTVSVNFGRPNGQRITVSTLRIMSKEITFEVRGEGKERLLDMIKDFDIQPTTIPDTEWTEQQMVNSPDATPDDYPHIAVDTSDRPWVIWSDGDDTNGFDLHYTKWNGSDWDEETGLFSQNETRHLPRITFDDQNRAWVVYSKQYPDNTHDIFFTRCVEGSWEPERMVNLPDSTDYDFGPRIAFGGGQVWCCWYGNVITNRYKIYVSRWNGDSWEPETQISPQDTWHHWFCDIAVDSIGNPHVVWGALSMDPGIVYYCTYDGTRWLEPETLNNPQLITPNPWFWCGIAIDKEGDIHVVWAGIEVGQNRHGIFYSKKTNGRWLEPVRVNLPNSYEDECPDIITKGHDDIWVGWDRYVTTWVSYIYVSHLDSVSWLPEEQLDDNSVSYANCAIQMAFVNDEVWTVWMGWTIGIDHADIYYSRHLASDLTEGQSKIMGNPNIQVYPNPFNHDISFFYKRVLEECVSFTIYDRCGKFIRTLTNQKQEAKVNHLHWDGKDMNKKEIPDGIYFTVLKLGKWKEIKKIIKIK